MTVIASTQPFGATLRRPGDKGRAAARPREAELRPELAAAAGYLGLDRAELRARLRDGETLAALARERGRPLARLIETMVAIARARLDPAVAAGGLTAVARDDILRDLRERIYDTAGRAITFPSLAV